MNRTTKFIVLLDDGTGRNNGHHFGTYSTRRAAERGVQRAEAAFGWIAGAYIREVPLDYIHDPAKAIDRRVANRDQGIPYPTAAIKNTGKNGD